MPHIKYDQRVSYFKLNIEKNYIVVTLIKMKIMRKLVNFLIGKTSSQKEISQGGIIFLSRQLYNTKDTSQILYSINFKNI